MKLRFIDRNMADKFKGLVSRHGYAPSEYDEGGWIVIESGVDGKERRALMSEWCKISMEENSQPNNNQGKLKL